MEVQKHPHHVMHKKKFGEYILEFFMLFLAVFLGFVAENIREHIVENRKEKEYIISMTEDLKQDTTKLSVVIRANQAQSAGFDSLINYWYLKPYSDSSVRYMYYLYRKYLGKYSKMVFNQRTIEQLKNAGGMSLVRNKTASDTIVNYYDNVSRANTQVESFNFVFEQSALQTSYKIFDWSYMRNIPTSYAAYKILQSPERFAFLDASVADKNTFIAELQEAGAVLRVYIAMLFGQRQRCLRLLSVLKENYHLRNE